MDTSSRRTFLGVCLGGVVAGFSAAVLWPLYRYLAPRSGGELTTRVVIAEKDVPEGEAKFFEYAGASAVLVRKKGGELVALSAVCTHLGCIVQWEKEKQDFLCPCHAGRYTPDGTVISGPPPKPLAKLPFSVANGEITVG
ncbi:MAG: ubiquinol-cytochrome c reductase iron-sulfur subunit [Desulfobacteraceae bacterium]|nr:ubiquinol-cytochrome c reductase iron-sulfur subunit [Desulfobacteraceae bacterium]